MSDVTYKTMTVPLAASASNSFALGDPNSIKVPSAVLFPASLRGTLRIKFQVSHDDSTYYNLYSGTNLIYIVSTVSVLVAVPDIIQQLAYGWEYIRIVTMDGSNAAAVTSVGSMIMQMFIISADIDNPSVPDPNAVGGTVAATSAGDVASATADSGNPVKIAGVYESSPAAVSNGQRRNVGINPLGAILVAFDTAGTAGADAAATLAGAMTRSAGAVGGSNPLAAGLFGYNGATWDRIRSRGVGILQVEQAFSFLNIAAGQATTTVKSGAGTLKAIVFNGPATATSTTTVYDNTAASGTVIAIPLATAVVAPTSVAYDLAFATGLTIITATANGANMTVVYR